jgi:hypothetical protein
LTQIKRFRMAQQLLIPIVKSLKEGLMKELTLRRLVALQLDGGYIYEIEEDKIHGDSTEDLEEQIRFIINSDRSVLNIETIWIVDVPVIRSIVAA